MDHLVTACPHFAHIEVPYLFDESCPFIYDNQLWSEYPERVGWDLKTFHDADFTNGGRNTTHQASAFLQTWLYFGIMHAVTGVPVNTNDFIRINDHRKHVVSTTYLPQYFSRWKEHVSALSEEEKLELIVATDAAVKTLTDTITLYIGWRTPLSNEVILSITILHKTLMCAKRVALPESDYVPTIPYYQDSREVIDDQLYKRGWCKRDVAKHHQSHSCLAMYFAISLGPRLVNRDHPNCSLTDCSALQVDESTYVTKHATSGCDCKHIKVDIEALSSVIESGATPLIRLSQPPRADRHRLDIITHRNYVCVTHVWVDGLGNPYDNSLPTCQLILLQESVNALYPHKPDNENIPFWIDSLCIPVSLAKVVIRKQAIAAMARVYSQAEKVLVLESELQMSSRHTSKEEIALRISFSVWWSRLWTLQEGIFAKELWFQFRDGPLDGKKLVEQNDRARRVSSTFGWSASEEICYEGLGYLRELYSFRSEPATSRATFILQAVNWRSSSKLSDETICLATLFNLDVNILLKTPMEDRLKKFILMQQYFPSTSLFFSGAKMDEDGFRWAPKTFVFSRAGLLPAYQRNPDQGSSRFERQTTLAKADIEGLHVELFGFRLEVLEGSSTVDGHTLVREETSELWYTLRPMKKTIATPFVDLELYQIPNLSLVLPVCPADGTLYYGILVSVYKEEDGVLFSRFVSRVTLHQWGTRSLVSVRSVLGIEEPRPAKAKRLKVDQKWCIG